MYFAIKKKKKRRGHKFTGTETDTYTVSGTSHNIYLEQSIFSDEVLKLHIGYYNIYDI